MTRHKGQRPSRHVRSRRPTSTRPSRAGERHELVCGPVGHGGFVVARLDGLAVFVRHALPGERVVAQITEGREGDRFLRADTIEVLDASPHRVEPPCPFAGPGACGGCDWQHATPAYQRELKSVVVREQLSRLADVQADVEVREVDPLLHWRSTMQYVDLPGGHRGLRKHRSHEVVMVDDGCLLDAHADRTDPLIEVRAQRASKSIIFEVAPDAFWQPHVAAPTLLVEQVLELARPKPEETALDLYAGAGLFAAFLAEAGVEVIAVEGAPVAAREDVMQVRSDVQAWLEGPEAPEHVDLVVLDPPRTGAKRRVVEGIVARGPARVVYVACDPAALARDVAIFAEHGYALTDLRAFDLFPMTQHVECVALLTIGG